MKTVRDAAFDVWRAYGSTTLFCNPGSTEVPLLTDLPSDLSFVLALHEGSVVGMATGWAMANDQPGLVILHTTAGLGNAVGALATARVNRVPLVVLVGQQDRRHLVLEPFLTGKLAGLAGDYPVWTGVPPRPQDVPSLLARGWHEANRARGPALVVVPMDDWTAPAGADEVVAAPTRAPLADAVDPAIVSALAGLVAEATAPALVVGAGADSEPAWNALVALTERLDCPVWQESFGARAGFPQDHRLFAGQLPAGRARLRSALAGHDLVVAVGAPVFRQYGYEPGPLVEAGTRIAVVTDDPAEAHRSPVELAVVAPPALVCARLVDELPDRLPDKDSEPRSIRTRHPVAAPPDTGEPLRPAHVFSCLASRAPRDLVVVEETPSSRPDLHALLPATAPMGFVSAAMGGLGFALPAATGIRMARPDRPVVAVVGDGSALYGVQALWSAARYDVGVLFVVLANGRYAVMDRLAETYGGKPAWPGFETVSMRGLADALGCPARRIQTHDELAGTLDEVVPTLRDRDQPLLLDIAVATDSTQP